MRDNSNPSRFYLLDNLRGLAALAVVLGHWQHFFYVGTKAADFIPERLPLSWILMPIYAEGHRAVDLFFSLSGFIFFWLYSQRIENKEVTLKEFAVLRFSRLYPLHFATLLAVAVGQYFSLRHFGQFMVYPANDAGHFLAQLFFASNWFNGEASFNAPIWSVSVEIMLYFIFFWVCARHLTKTWPLLALAFIGYATKQHWIISRGILGFFLGGLVYQVYARLSLSNEPKKWRNLAGGAGLLAWVAVPLNYHAHLLEQAATPIGSFALHYADKITQDSFAVILFPLTILALALWESRLSVWARRLSFLGDISYSSYLLHFPLQMAVMMVVMTFHFDPAMYSSPLCLLAFFSLLILTSLACHKFFERPAQKFFRQKFLRA